MIPKAPKEQETCKDGQGENAINPEGTSKDSSSQIDRMTGLSVPATRVPRTKKTTSTKSRKAKGKERVGASNASNKKGKGKEKEVPSDHVPMDEDTN